MATRGHWHPFQPRNMKFQSVLNGFSWILDDFSMILDDFWYFMCAHFGTVTQCSVDPRCASSAYLKTSRNTLKHLRNFEKLSETLKKSHETSRKWIFFEFRSISINVLSQKAQNKARVYFITSNLAKKRKYRFYSWKKGKPTAPSVPRLTESEQILHFDLKAG